MPAYKDKNGKWFAKFYYKDWKGENKQKWKRGFATKKEAQEFEREFLLKQALDPDMTFASMYEIYIEDLKKRIKESTLITKQSIFDHAILPFFGNMRVSEIQAPAIRKWQTELMNNPKGYSKTYLKTIHTQLTSFYNYAHKFYGISDDPIRRAGPIGSSVADEMNYWSIDEYMKFREGIKDKKVSYICFEVLYWTGIREGELLGLTSEDFDFESNIIHIRRTFSRVGRKEIISTPKTKKSKRDVPMPDFLAKEIQEYVGQMYIFKDDRIFPVTKSFLTHEMERGCKKTNVKKIRIHDIRHSHASLLINNGCDILVVAERLGHEKVSTTLNTYSHLYPTKQQGIVSMLENICVSNSIN